MGRQQNRYPLRSQQPGANGVKAGRVQKQRKKNKVVLESAGTKDHDKLRVTVRARPHKRRKAGTHNNQLSFRAEPPAGYTFIPAGNTQLTAAMKTFAKKGGHQIMAVSVGMIPESEKLLIDLGDTTRSKARTITGSASYRLPFPN